MSVANPNGSKIILDYTDITEASSWEEPSLFSGSTRPSWFGGANPDWPGVYSVQYWNPAWLTVLESRINQVIAQGYNGIFLDVASGDSEWAAGNSFGNATNPNATAELGTLITELRAYVNGLHLANPFYLVANDPQNVAQQDPSALKSLDAVFNETLYYGSSGASGSNTAYALPASSQNYVENVLGPAYANAGLPVLGSDYPTTGNLSQDFQSFAAYSALGWIPSVVNAANTGSTLTSGPYMAMAVAGNTTVQGSQTLINFLSGGTVANATLIGGPKGDFFIGGPGQNTITGGAGNDTIYAHPAAAALLNQLQFQLVGDWLGAANPTVEVLVNGHVALAPVTLTQNLNTAGYSWQTVSVNANGYGPITSVELVSGGTYWTSNSNYSMVFLKSAEFDGLSIPITSLTYSSGSGISSGSSVALLGGSGTATLSGSVLPASPFLANTSDTINGGGGVNTVDYRAASNDYSIVREANGEVLVTALDTAEGPDILTNIQTLQFTDKSIAINSQPLAASATTYAASQGAALSVSAANGLLANTIDYNGLTLSTALATNGGPQHGTLVLNANGSFTYTPDAGFSGTDSFTYVAKDGLSATTPITITLNVAAAAVSGPTTHAASYGDNAGHSLTTTAANGVLAGDSDPNGLTMTAALAANGGPQHGTLVLNADGSFTYTPTLGFAGTDSFTYIASDSLGSSAPTTVTLNVTAQGLVTQAASYGDNAGHSLTTTAANGVLAGDSDPNGLTLTAALAANGGPQHGTLVLNTDGSFTYTPTLGFAGTDSFTYIASDGLGSSAPTTVTLNVTAQGLVTQAASYSAHAGHALSETAANGVLAGDSDPNGLTLTAALAANGGPQHGTLVLNTDGSFTYTPTLGFAGTDSFTYIASDGLGSSAPTTVTLNVTAQGLVTQAASYSAHAGHALSETAANGVLAGDSDPNGLTLTAALAANGGPQHGTLVLNADGSFTYTPNAGYVGTDSFSYVASDSLGSSPVSTVNLAVTDNAPTGNADAYSATEGATLNISTIKGVLANDVATDGLALSTELDVAPQHGTLVLDANGSFSYTPDAGFVGVDTFVYTPSDGLTTGNAATVTITVAAATASDSSASSSSSSLGSASLASGTGNDTHVVTSSTQQVVVAAGTPNETAEAYCSYSLPANVQNLVGKTTAAITLVGNAMNNVITAGTGADTLTGGGSDTFVTATADKMGTITDFSASDKIDISSFQSAGLAPTFADYGAYSTVTFSDGDTIKLLGVQASSLSVSGHYIV